MKPEVARQVGQLVLVVSLFLLVAPVVNVGIQVYPLNPGNQSWRFGSLGFFLGALTLPTLGLGLLALSGVIQGSLNVVRLAMLLSFLFLLVTVFGLVDFLIEARALRAVATDPRIQQLVDLEVGRTRILAGVAIPALAGLGIWSYKVSKALRAEVAAGVDPNPLIRAGGR